MANPFTERGRITNPARFVGRWSELSLLFERLEANRPVLIRGVAGIGKSSLLTHVSQSAATNLDDDELRSYYMDAAEAPGADAVYRAVIGALGSRGDTLAALQVALIEADLPVLLCIDNIHGAVAAGWGAQLLEDLARVGRVAPLLLVATLEGTPPEIGERVAVLGLGAFAQTEVRLLADAYLDDTSVVFRGVELRALYELSAGHPAYLQRAAYHLYEHKCQREYNWVAAYLAEARERPVPGAPLPPTVFEGAASRVAQLVSDETDEQAVEKVGPAQLALPESEPLLVFAVPLLVAALVWSVGRNLVAALLVALLGCGVVWLLLRWTRRNQHVPPYGDNTEQ